MSFWERFLEFEDLNIDKIQDEINDETVKQVIEKPSLDWRDLLVLLSEPASLFMEEMARKAQEKTLKNFGRVIFLYAPLYLANYCENECLYCSFNRKNKLKRRKLSLKEIEKESEAVLKSGIKDILILTGESREHTPISYLEDAVDILSRSFSSISIEIYPLNEDEYRRLIDRGVDGLTVYQETYNRDKYDYLHPRGPKKDFRFRLNTPERACRAGMRRVNIGPLFGLDDWRRDAFFTAIHGRFLQKNHPQVEFSLSLPRLREHLGRFNSSTEVNDKDLVQILLAFRLYLPRFGINLSTRESAVLRDQLIPLGITKLSAGSSTVVGGYSVDSESSGQFDISDQRSVEDIIRLVKNKGYQPVCKDWEIGFQNRERVF